MIEIMRQLTSDARGCTDSYGRNSNRLGRYPHARGTVDCDLNPILFSAPLHVLQIGGIGPELNEDYSTSHIMTACGFKGVFGINTIANGDGPVNFEDCMRQEYQ